MQTVVETPAYLSDAKYAGLDDDDRNRVVDFVARNPNAGDVIEGSGGVRKVRIARRGSGKSGGFRVLAAYLGADIPVFLLAVFAKNEKANISKSDIHALVKVMNAIKVEARRKRSPQ